MRCYLLPVLLAAMSLPFCHAVVEELFGCCYEMGYGARMMPCCQEPHENQPANDMMAMSECPVEDRMGGSTMFEEWTTCEDFRDNQNWGVGWTSDECAMVVCDMPACPEGVDAYLGDDCCEQCDYSNTEECRACADAFYEDGGCMNDAAEWSLECVQCGDANEKVCNEPGERGAYCRECATRFAEAGGCAVMDSAMSEEEIEALIPENCYICGPSAFMGCGGHQGDEQCMFWEERECNMDDRCTWGQAPIDVMIKLFVMDDVMGSGRRIQRARRRVEAATSDAGSMDLDMDMMDMTEEEMETWLHDLFGTGMAPLPEMCFSSCYDYKTAEECTNAGCDADEFQKKCPPVMCEMWCENGFATGEDGCEVCQCQDLPALDNCIDCVEAGYAWQIGECQMMSHGSATTNMDYCVVMDVGCAYEPEMCSSRRLTSTMVGDERDEYGCCTSCGESWCQASGQCLRSFEADCPCPEMMCMMWCDNGFATDDWGCPICKCNEAPQLGKEGDSCGFLMGGECEDGLVCIVDWITGTCTSPSCDDPNATWNECGSMCPDNCQGEGAGLFCIDSIDMCQQGCECNENYIMDNESGMCVLEEDCPAPEPKQPVCRPMVPDVCPPVMCLLLCENGFAIGDDGCEICECQECPCGESCTMDGGGSGVCQADNLTCAVNILPPQCDVCPPVTCLMSCENGFAIGDDGCEICECQDCPCGESCTMDGGGNGVCQSDNLTCAVNFLPPQCEAARAWYDCGIKRNRRCSDDEICDVSGGVVCQELTQAASCQTSKEQFCGETTVATPEPTYYPTEVTLEPTPFPTLSLGCPKMCGDFFNASITNAVCLACTFGISMDEVCEQAEPFGITSGCEPTTYGMYKNFCKDSDCDPICQLKDSKCTSMTRRKAKKLMCTEVASAMFVSCTSLPGCTDLTNMKCDKSATVAWD